MSSWGRRGEGGFLEPMQASTESVPPQSRVMTVECRLFRRSNDQRQSPTSQSSQHAGSRLPGFGRGTSHDRQAQLGPHLRDHLQEFSNPQPIPPCGGLVSWSMCGKIEPMSPSLLLACMLGSRYSSSF